MKLLKSFSRNEDGATAIEYGLIAALIALAIIFGANQLGGALNSTFSDIADCVKTPDASTC